MALLFFLNSSCESFRRYFYESEVLPIFLLTAFLKKTLVIDTIFCAVLFISKSCHVLIFCTHFSFIYFCISISNERIAFLTHSFQTSIDDESFVFIHSFIALLFFIHSFIALNKVITKFENEFVEDHGRKVRHVSPTFVITFGF